MKAKLLKAEILATGNEVLTGVVADTNSAYIASRLEETGIEVRRHVCVGDDPELIADAVTEMCKRSDLVIVTGGLGPTGDDITAGAVAKAAGKPLVFSKEAHRSMSAYFERRKKQFQRSDTKQAMLPEGAECIANEVGTAAGFSIKIGKCHLFAMPGVPREMKWMLDAKVLPRTEALAGSARMYTAKKTVSVFGLPEAVVGERMAGFDEAFPDAAYGIRVSFPEIFVTVSTRKQDPAEADSTVNSACSWIVARIGDCAFSDNGASLPEVVGRLLLSQKETVAVAESCTGGLVAHLLTSIPGSSGYFLFSGVTYSNNSKMNVLGVSEDTIFANGAVSQEVAREMALGTRKVAGSTYAVATTGIAGPGGATKGKPVGTVCIGLAAPDGVESITLELSFGDRGMNKRVFAFCALDMLRRKLLQGRK